MIKFTRPTRGKVRPSYNGSRGDLLKLGPALKLQGRNSLLSLEAGIVTMKPETGCLLSG